jgi:iron(III) transport system substrate-binding protein
MLFVLFAAGQNPHVQSAAQNTAWDQVVKAAVAEGRVVVGGPPGTQWRDAVMKFEGRYSGIHVEFMGAVGADHATRILAERRGGQYQWDALIVGAATGLSLKRQMALESLKRALVQPSVLYDKAWRGGFADGWMDKDNQLVYCFMGEVSPEVYVNRDLVPESDLKRVEDLAAPRWRGMISWSDPRAPGGGSLQAANLMFLLGEPFLRSVLKQDIAVTTDLRQQMDWIVRGRYPIAMSLDYRFLADYQKQGLGMHVVPLAPDTPAGGGSRLSPGFGCVTLIDRTPHPNAGKVFVNWVLSQEGQESFVKETGVNSRRLDVSLGREIARPRTDVTYYTLSREDRLDYNDRAIAIAKEILK